ncbi:MAG: hypothetical protein K8U03_12870 [Planctomycetia bacterium]|nr:hypothetical protein [Planctomycetia bacterium]
MFEHKSEPLLSRYRFMGRMLRSLGITYGIGIVSLVLGAVGYCYFGELAWLDGLLNASMILTGMGPVDPMRTDGGKLFASLYALYSGIAFLSIMAVITAPIFHRILHRFHLEEDDDDDQPASGKAPKADSK